MFDFEDVRLFAKPVPVPPFWVRLAGVSYCDATYFVAREHSEITVMEYIVSGTGTLTIGGETLHPSAGDVYILPKGSTHRYAADSNPSRNVAEIIAVLYCSIICAGYSAYIIAYIVAINSLYITLVIAF